MSLASLYLLLVTPGTKFEHMLNIIGLVPSCVRLLPQKSGTEFTVANVLPAESSRTGTHIEKGEGLTTNKEVLCKFDLCALHSHTD